MFPTALWISSPCAVISFLLNVGKQEGWVNWGDFGVLQNKEAWSGFTALVGFLIVFRTSQAYSRFWEGCTAIHKMRAEWYDAAVALIAFCSHSRAAPEMIQDFQHTLIRLTSMLMAAALGELEDKDLTEQNRCCHRVDISNLQYEIIDARGIDSESLTAVKQSESRVELIFTWIQVLIVEQINTGVLSIPPPILSRAFQELSNGMVAYTEATKIGNIPFPFPYAQTCDCLLVIHWLCIPVIIAMWVKSPYWAALFSFIQVFILWSLNFIAVEIDNPFGLDSNDINGRDFQMEMNRDLLILVHPITQRAPSLEDTAIRDCGKSINVNRTHNDMMLQGERKFTDSRSDPLHSVRDTRNSSKIPGRAPISALASLTSSTPESTSPKHRRTRVSMFERGLESTVSGLQALERNAAPQSTAGHSAAGCDHSLLMTSTGSNYSSTANSRSNSRNTLSTPYVSSTSARNLTDIPCLHSAISGSHEDPRELNAPVPEELKVMTGCWETLQALQREPGTLQDEQGLPSRSEASEASGQSQMDLHAPNLQLPVATRPSHQLVKTFSDGRSHGIPPLRLDILDTVVERGGAGENADQLRLCGPDAGRDNPVICLPRPNTRSDTRLRL